MLNITGINMIDNVVGPLSQMPGMQTNMTNTIDDYVPPSSVPTAPVVPAAPTMPAMPAAPVAPAVPVVPPVIEPSVVTPVTHQVSPVEPPKPTQPQDLRSQNIFFLLGLDAEDQAKKDEFLDGLQKIIWDDFLQNDVKLLLTTDELTKFEEIQKAPAEEMQKQEQLVDFLENLIPDLDEIILEKALELKADMFEDRITDLKRYYVGKADILTKISEAERLMKQDLWFDAAHILNQL